MLAIRGPLMSTSFADFILPRWNLVDCAWLFSQSISDHTMTWGCQTKSLGRQCLVTLRAPPHHLLYYSVSGRKRTSLQARRFVQPRRPCPMSGPNITPATASSHISAILQANPVVHWQVEILSWRASFLTTFSGSRNHLRHLIPRCHSYAHWDRCKWIFTASL